MTLAEKSVVILGGGSGIGLATAKALIAERARVIITGRPRDRLQAAQAELGSEVRTVPSTVADETGTRALFEGLHRVDHLFITAATVAGELIHRTGLSETSHRFQTSRLKMQKR